MIDYPTLGWAALEWFTEYLPSPLDEDEPFVLTDEQARIILEWYRVDPERRTFHWRRGALQMAKGWGKSPLLAALALFELAGPARFDGFDANGECVGRPWGTGGDPAPWVQIAAVSEDQTDNTYDALYAFLNAGEQKAARDLGVDLGLGRLYLVGRPGKLTPVTSARDTREGQRVTFAVKDETHLWLPSKGGPKLSRVLNRNAAKMDGRTFESTNAPLAGEDSVAETTRKAWEKGRPGIFYYCVEAPAVERDDDDETLRRAFAVAYGDSWWVNLDRFVRESRDDDVPWEDVLQFNCNLIVKGVHRAVDPKQWDALACDRQLEPGEYVGLGFDGSETDDHTALVATTFDNHQVLLGWWDPAAYPDDSWRLEVEERLAEAFELYTVGLLLCDPSKWRTEITRWARKWGDKRVLEFPQSDRRMAPATDRWLSAIAGKEMSHDGGHQLRGYVVAAHRKHSTVRTDTGFLPILTKGDDRRKIDGAVTAVMSMEAAAQMPEKPREVKPWAAYA